MLYHTVEIVGNFSIWGRFWMIRGNGRRTGNMVKARKGKQELPGKNVAIKRL
jgi:hypothetical protein